MVAESRAGDAQGPSPTAPWEPGVGLVNMRHFGRRGRIKGRMQRVR